MSLDLSGVALGTLIAQALALPQPPVNPTPEQEATYQEAVAAQLVTWTTISSTLLTYITQNAVVATTDTVPALGLVAPPSGGPVTGVAAGTGTGTIG